MTKIILEINRDELNALNKFFMTLGNEDLEKLSLDLQNFYKKILALKLELLNDLD
jgi:hypothetical protein